MIIAQRNFSSGEISPSLQKRVDLNRYMSASKAQRNFTTERFGGARNRSGFRYINNTKSNAKTCRLIPFIFNNDQTYVLEFGDEYMRVHKQGATIYNPPETFDSIDYANLTASYVEITDTVMTLIAGEEVQIITATGQPIAEGRNFKVAAIVGTTAYLIDMTGQFVDPAGWVTIGGPVTLKRVYEIATPYDEVDLMDLDFHQSGDVITIVHRDYTITDLARLADDDWQFDGVSFAPVNATQIATIAATPQGAAGTKYYAYFVVPLDPITLKENYPSFASTATGNATLTDANFNKIDWTLTANPNGGFNIYKRIEGRNGIHPRDFGFIGAVDQNVLTFNDKGIAPDETQHPPYTALPFGPTDGSVDEPFGDDLPGSIVYFNQRQMFGGTNSQPETVSGSRIGRFRDFSKNNPIQDDDTLKFTLVGQLLSEIRYMMDIGRLAIFTSTGEWVANGDQAGGITPTQINVKRYSANGVARGLKPLMVNSNCVYMQARGNIVREFGYRYEIDGFTGDELNIFSNHLFKGYTIIDWCYQQVPNSIIWAVRSDGVLLGCTYLKDQQIMAWHRHDTDGLVERVVAVPEGDEDALYAVVVRQVRDVTVRYLERLSTRNFTDIESATFLDSHLSYDGRNTDPNHSMTLSGGTWAEGTPHTLTSLFGFFTVEDVGNQIWLYTTNDDGDIFVVKLTITAFTSDIEVTVTPDKDVITRFRNQPIYVWTRAVDQVSGLNHLDGRVVGVFADGNVEANPNRPPTDYPVHAVVNGVVDFLGAHYGVVTVGLPYTSDLGTLNIDTVNGETLMNKNKLVTEVNVEVEESNSFWAGAKEPKTPHGLDGMTEAQLRDDEDGYAQTSPKTGLVPVQIQGEWNRGGGVWIRQVDPVPLSILAIAPTGMFPFRG